jgi:ABC-type transport system substrate-binding protein
MKPVSGSTRRKRLAITGTTFFLACLLVFCGRSGDVPPEEHARDLNVLRIDVNGPIKSLNPMADYHCGSGIVNLLLYSYLFSLDEKGALQPDLAAQWSYDPSVPAWDIQLRKDASFHDGNPVTSKDVKYSPEPETTASSASMLGARPWLHRHREREVVSHAPVRASAPFQGIDFS